MRNKLLFDNVSLKKVKLLKSFFFNSQSFAASVITIYSTMFKLMELNNLNVPIFKAYVCYSVIIKPSYYSCFKKLWVNNVESEGTTLCYFTLFVLGIVIQNFMISMKSYYMNCIDLMEKRLYFVKIISQ